MPGFVAGASLVFVKVFDDLGTPLVLGVDQHARAAGLPAHHPVGLDDPLGYVISVIMIAFSILALWLSARVAQGQGLRDAAEGRHEHRSAGR